MSGHLPCGQVSGELISVSEVESELPSSSAAAVAATVIPPVNPHPRLSITESTSNLSGWDILYDPKKAVNGIFSKRKASADANIPLAPKYPKYPFRGMTANVLQCLQCLHRVLFYFIGFILHIH